jgi:hypothetical protein
VNRRLAVLVAVALLGCGTAARETRTAAAARGYRYSDDSGLTVTTLAAEAEVSPRRSVMLEGRAIAERIQVHAGAGEGALAGHEGHAGHSHGATPEVDVVSGASTTARAGTDSSLWRYEGQLGAHAGVGTRAAPADFGVEGRISTEPDYLSLSGIATGRLDLFERNFVVAASAGFGRDRIAPSVPPPGERDLWPAHHARVFVALSLSQVLGPSTLLSGTVTLGSQSGTLENPYRRVLVHTTLFPERVPDVRRRLAASLGLARYLGGGLAGHLRNGFYADDWGVLAYVPELALAWDASTRFLFDAHARGYTQTSARFYEPQYHELLPELSADVRLGALRESSFGGYAELRLLLPQDGTGSLVLTAGYDLSLLHYRELARHVTGHLVNVGLRYAR